MDIYEREQIICELPQDFDAKGESTVVTRFHFKTKEFILTLFSTLFIFLYLHFLVFQRTHLRQLLLKALSF